MNCKQGDLAIIVESAADNAGKIVRCVKAAGVCSMFDRHGTRRTEAAWEVDPPLPGWAGDVHNKVFDAQLRPIRDPGDDAKDEMLRPLPKEVHA